MCRLLLYKGKQPILLAHVMYIKSIKHDLSLSFFFFTCNIILILMNICFLLFSFLPIQLILLSINPLTHDYVLTIEDHLMVKILLLLLYKISIYNQR